MVRHAADAEAMRGLGRSLAGRLAPGDLVVLTGSLGAGKTTLTQGIGAGLGVRGAVTSPTFVIARVHPSEAGGPDLVHADAYRLGGLAELDDLDLDADLDHAVTVVEWGEGLAEGLSESRLEVRIVRGGTTRTTSTARVELTPVGPRWHAVSFRGLRMTARDRARLRHPLRRTGPTPRPGAARSSPHLDAMDPRPDVLLVTGDVADHGLPEEYAEAREVLVGLDRADAGRHRQPRRPRRLRRGLLDRPADGPLHQVLETDGPRFLVLDSLVTAPPGERIDHGELAPDGALARRPARGRRRARRSSASTTRRSTSASASWRRSCCATPSRSPRSSAGTSTWSPPWSATPTPCARRPSPAGRCWSAGGAPRRCPYDAEDLPGRLGGAPPSFALHLLHDDGRLTSHWRAL